MSATTVSGWVASGYEPVRAAFERLVEDGIETGAGLSVWADGTEVVGLSGGWADTARRRPWRSDTLVTTYSTSKPFAALTALVAVAQGALTLDEPVAAHWKDYACGGKEATTLRDILTHRAGLPVFPSSAATVDMLDDAALRRCLASATAESAPGTNLAEHALTYGHLIDGVLRAATGRSLGEIYAEVVRPALDIDAWFGVPEADLGRVADLEHALGSPERLVAEVSPSYERALAIPAGVMEPARLNTAGWRQAVFGACNLIASATGLATFYASLTSADGPVRRLLGEELHAEYLTTQVCGRDETAGATLNWTLGPVRTPNFIGLGGLGGSAAYWSLRHDHAVAYVTRRLHDHSRVAAIAAVLNDDLNREVTC
ncbi:serine hydrolase domain-containing protein [Actinomadura madurae]|nr:serine hydrolase domain-containing protein [Actinomadura madurae]MCP9950917.1 beta-lactamase family protein [Actinomadura madurae]MCP9980151.1 beta-lactamase family protein [Actinomadura madurae]MCQ0008320.1 beta-lactamase family protein [Actinomadura madurae]URM96457.1 beta-lactamase family protein [Actinomadura madurae]